MAGITLNAGRCVRSLSVNSTCDACITNCPTEALVATEAVPAVNLAACVGCGGCVGACPTEAIGLDGFGTTDFFFSFVAEEERLLSCRKNVPCISVLSVDHLLSLALLKGGLVLDTGHCDGCDIAGVCRPAFEARAEEASYLLEAMQSGARIVLEAAGYEAPVSETEAPDRRGFFQAINLKSLAAGKAKFEREVETATDELIRHQLDSTHIAQLRTKTIPDRRKLLFTALRRAEKPERYHVVEADELTFSSQKLFDTETCTACQMCYRVCPTGALSSDVRNSKIDFDAMMCVRCHLCHDVCEPDALTLSPSYSIREMFEPAVQRLVRFTVQNCDECGSLFTSLHGERLCYRCRIEEEEARALWGIPEEA